MYKCRLTYDEWKCIISKNRVGKQVDLPQIKGYLGLLNINTVSEQQIWKHNDNDVIVCDSGYHWLSILPSNEFYCITAMMDNNYHFKVCYIDMIDSQGYDEDGVPYFYDLYLDLIVYPDGNIIVDDRYSSAQDFALRCKVCKNTQWLRSIKPSRSDYAWLDACNKKPKAELLRMILMSYRKH